MTPLVVRRHIYLTGHLPLHLVHLRDPQGVGSEANWVADLANQRQWAAECCGVDWLRRVRRQKCIGLPDAKNQYCDNACEDQSKEAIDDYRLTEPLPESRRSRRIKACFINGRYRGWGRDSTLVADDAHGYRQNQNNSEG